MDIQHITTPASAIIAMEDTFSLQVEEGSIGNRVRRERLLEHNLCQGRVEMQSILQRLVDDIESEILAVMREKVVICEL